VKIRVIDYWITWH